MRITLTKQVNYFEVDTAFKLKLGPLFRLFQEAAIEHSEKVGLGSKTLVDTGSVWILNRIEAEILRMPEYLEKLSVVTWHKGSKGYRAYRDFVVSIGEETVAAATSMWLYLDMRRKRIMRIPEDVSAAYTTETESALNNHIDRWKADTDFAPTVVTPISLRACDYDPLGHVNNAVYFDYVETLATHAFQRSPAIRSLKIEFKKELGQNIETIEAGLAQTPNGHHFKIFNRDTVYAAGEMRLNAV